jgi:hypothetical protein
MFLEDLSKHVVNKSYVMSLRRVTPWRKDTEDLKFKKITRKFWNLFQSNETTMLCLSYYHRVSIKESLQIQQACCDGARL